jgi:hypothetical protein
MQGANIVRDHLLILPDGALPTRMDLSERTGLLMSTTHDQLSSLLATASSCRRFQNMD